MGKTYRANDDYGTDRKRKAIAMKKSARSAHECNRKNGRRAQ